MPFWEGRTAEQRETRAAAKSAHILHGLSAETIETIVHSSSSELDMRIGQAIQDNKITPEQARALIQQWDSLHRS